MAQTPPTSCLVPPTPPPPGLALQALWSPAQAAFPNEPPSPSQTHATSEDPRACRGPCAGTSPILVKTFLSTMGAAGKLSKVLYLPCLPLLNPNL